MACRISLAIKQSNIVDSKLTDTFKNVETEWNNLLPFIIGSPAFVRAAIRFTLNGIAIIWPMLFLFTSSQPPEDRFDFSHCILDDKDLSNLKLACGVCLLNVKASLPESRMGRQSSEDFKLAYGGRQYHCTCANFWVNFVDSLLPALPFKSRSGS